MTNAQNRYGFYARMSLKSYKAKSDFLFASEQIASCIFCNKKLVLLQKMLAPIQGL